MKTIVAVIVVLTYTFATVAAETCQNELQMQNLNTQRFFKGDWYVTYIKDGTKDAACRQYKTKIEGVLVKLTADGDYTFKGQTKKYTTTCSTTTGTSLNPTGPFVLKCMHTYDKDKSHIFFDLKMSVVETDYDNYALVYRCTTYDDQSLNINYGNYVLLMRNKNADVAKVTASLSNPNWSLSRFTKTAGC
uniref:Salivary lipocalin n=1 Tax=Triatoma matogrossensis TaxID=162370 RepID=E2J755_9HEMI